MRRGAAPGLALLCAACAPSYAWGDVAQVERKLLNIVPTGSSFETFSREAKKRQWVVAPHGGMYVGDGQPTYFHDHDTDCRSLPGGRVVPAIVATYPTPFETTVETLWIFDARGRVRRVCVRKTTDAL
jgi:hypothetical protein